MSSRALRRLKQDDLTLESEGDEDMIVKPKQSLFAMLAPEESDEPSDHEDPKPSESIKASIPKKPSKKKGKRPVPEEDFDKMLAEFKVTEITEAPVEDDWLAVDEAHLNPEREMRKKFGDLQEEAPVKVSMPKQRRHRKLRKQLIEPRPTWPPIAASLVGMHLEKSEGEWRLVESAEQVVLSDELTEIVELGDISLLAQHVRMHPLHVDAMLLYSDYLRMHSVGEAAEMVELAMLCLERALLADGFSLFVDQLPYALGSNRTFHLAMFRHVQYLARRGCYRTALEMSKLALRLDRTDPLGVSYLLEFLAAKVSQDDPQVREWFLTAQTPEPITWNLTRALIRGRIDNLTPEACLILRVLQGKEASAASPFMAALAKLYAARNAPLWKDCHFDVPEAPTNYTPALLEEISLHRHIILSDLPNVTVPIPSHLSWMSVHALDPIPPEILEDATDKRCIIS